MIYNGHEKAVRLHLFQSSRAFFLEKYFDEWPCNDKNFASNLNYFELFKYVFLILN